MLMDAPPPVEDVRPFVHIGRKLTALGFSAPDILSADEDKGFLFVRRLRRRYLHPHVGPGGGRARRFMPWPLTFWWHCMAWHRAWPFPTARLLTDMDALFKRSGVVDGLVFARRHRQRTHLRMCATVTWLVGKASLGPVADNRDALVLRDYHVDNLMWLPERAGVRRCGLLDFQDALAGSPAYDVMSLLEDARRDIPPTLKSEMLARYVSAFPNLDEDGFVRDMAILGAGRHAKVIGIFVRLCVRDGKDVYLHHIPRVWRLFEAALAHPALADMKTWLDTHVPSALRSGAEIRK